MPRGGRTEEESVHHHRVLWVGPEQTDLWRLLREQPEADVGVHGADSIGILTTLQQQHHA